MPYAQVCMVLRYVADEIAMYSDDMAVRCSSQRCVLGPHIAPL